MKIEVSAPSNIALIKYMGKVDTSSNIPSNASLSYTVEHLKTYIEVTEASDDQWQLLEGYYPMQLSQKGQLKFLRFFKKLKDRLQVKGSFLLKSANTFPSDAGLASSASSFAALTLAAWDLSKRQHGVESALKILVKDSGDSEVEALAKISREGSGSSCRSFFSGYCVWDKTDVKQVTFPYENLYHIVFLLEESKKTVSSSEAHLRVVSSPHFKGRAERAEQRLNELSLAMKEMNWKVARKVVWDEFIDMHQLFESAVPPFQFMNAETHKLLEALQSKWNTDKDGPIVTMDAGPNVHLFFHEGQKQMYTQYKKDFSIFKLVTGNET